jgi:membrane fusion protein (multidrug efflux system)
MKLRSALLLLLIAALAGFAGCARHKKAAVDLGRPVVVQPVTVRDLDVTLEATGGIRAKDSATLASEVAGPVTEVMVDEGDDVKEGQVLLEIDPEKRKLELDNARARLTEAQADLKEQQRDLGRVRFLHKQAIASQSALDQATTKVALAQSRTEAALSQVGVAERALRDASVRSPFAGVVSRRAVSRGEYVQVGQPLFDIVSLDPVEVEFNVAERDSARVKDGQEVDVQVAPYPGQVFRGQVTMISPTIDPQTRTLRVKARIANPDDRLRPGLFARVDLGVAHRPGVLMVPEAAVLVRADGQILYLAGADDRAHKVAVETGVHRDGMVEITKGVRPGDQVIVRGHWDLVDGTLISRRTPDGAPDHTKLDVAADAVAGKNAP